MTLDDLNTIAGIMNNDCPSGNVEVINVVNGNYVRGRWKEVQFEGVTSGVAPCPVRFLRDGTVPKGVVCAVVWHAPGQTSKTLARYRTMNSGFPETVELEAIHEGTVGKYLRMIRMFAS